MGLWNSMVKGANHIEQGDFDKIEGLRFVLDNGNLVKHLDDKLMEKRIEFISPLKVEIELAWVRWRATQPRRLFCP